jgi:hypothetical protein
MQRTSQSRLRYQRLSQFPRLRALLAELLSPKPQRRRRRTSRREIIQLLLIILGSIVAVIAGLYGKHHIFAPPRALIFPGQDTVGV